MIDGNYSILFFNALKYYIKAAFFWNNIYKCKYNV